MVICKPSGRCFKKDLKPIIGRCRLSDPSTNVNKSIITIMDCIIYVILQECLRLAKELHICLIIIRNGFHVPSFILNVLMDHDEEWLSCMTLLWNA